MTDTKTKKMPAKAGKTKATKAKSASEARKPSRLDQLQKLITREGGASIAEMIEATYPLTNPDNHIWAPCLDRSPANSRTCRDVPFRFRLHVRWR